MTWASNLEMKLVWTQAKSFNQNQWRRAGHVWKKKGTCAMNHTCWMFCACDPVRSYFLLNTALDLRAAVLIIRTIKKKHSIQVSSEYMVLKWTCALYFLITFQGEKSKNRNKVDHFFEIFYSVLLAKFIISSYCFSYIWHLYIWQLSYQLCTLYLKISFAVKWELNNLHWWLENLIRTNTFQWN